MFKKILIAVKNHKIIFAILIIVLSVGGYFIFRNNNNTPAGTVYTYGKATVGTITQTISGTGQIEASKQTDITSKVAGNVAMVSVVAGQQVKKGDLIAKIKDDDGQDAVEDAQIALYDAQAALNDLAKPADELDLTKARNSVTQAQKTLENDKEDLDKSYEQGFNSVAGAFNDLPSIIAKLQEVATTADEYVVQSSPNYLEYYYNSVKSYDSSAASILTKAASSYQNLKSRYDNNFENYKSASRLSSNEDIESLIDETYETTRVVADALKNITNVIQNYEDNLNEHNMEPQEFANTQLTSLSGYTSSNNTNLSNLLSASQAIDTAKDTIETDKLSLEEYQEELKELQEGADEEDIQSAKYTVQQKERALDNAGEALEDYQIKAPFDGNIALINVNIGDDVSSGSAIATVITDNQIVTVSLNEVDIAKVRVGQQATLAFDAIEGLTMTGTVAEVATIGAVSSGVVNYDVTIALDSQNSQVKPGMSSSVTIITDIAQDVLTVPSSAVKTAEDDTYYVLIPSVAGSEDKRGAEAQVLKKTVTVGLDDGTTVEITSGLNESDQVIVGSVKTSDSSTSTSSSSGNSSRGFMMGGMGSGGPR